MPSSSSWSGLAQDGSQGRRPGNLRPGNLRPGNLRPGNLRPGNLRPGNLPFGRRRHPRIP